MFTPQLEFLKAQYRCIAFDFRGQGKSPATKSGYDMDNLTKDTIELISQLVDGPIHFVGLALKSLVIQHVRLIQPTIQTNV